uniref:Myosin XVIIIB n=1 Tax=Haplochromis burtoni TaxID=8153 RepID=A0A3Q2V6K9_HAPBU
MALSSRLKLWEKKGGIKEENKPIVTTVPHPPLSVLPGGFLKQLVRDSEKETKHKEPEVKEERPPNKLSDNLVQQFLLPDQTPPILEAEMSLRTEQFSDNSDNSQPQGRNSAQPDGRSSSQCHIVTPDSRGKPETRPDVTPEPPKQKLQQWDRRTEKKSKNMEEHTKKERIEEFGQGKEKEKGMEERQEPEGMQTETTVTENARKEVRDVWYEAGTVWYVDKDDFIRATQLKPDEGTPELSEGRVRVRLETDGSVHDVSEYEVEKCNPPELDLCEDLSDLQSVNECGALHTLTSRAKANLPLTHAGPNLVNFWPPLQSHSKTPKSRRGESVWDAPPALAALVKRVYMSMVGTRRDHSVCALGRSGTGKTTACQTFTHALIKQAGTAGENMMERVQAMFTILRSFGCVSSKHSDASSRFAMVFSLDFNHAGQAAAGHLQTLMLDKWKVCQKIQGESNFLVFSQMLAGLSICLRTVEEKQRASIAFTKLLSAMETLGFSPGEQKAIWHVLAGIYHLGAAGACKVGRRQFMNFDSAQRASSVLGCEGDDLHTAVFKHHLQQLLQRATGGSRERSGAAESEEGPRLTAAQCLNGMAAGLYEELFTAIVSLINRALSSQQLMLASVMVVDTPGLRNPRHSAEERGASWSEFCHNYLQERLLEHYHSHTFTHTLERYAQEKIHVEFECPETSPAEVVSAIDQPPPQVRTDEDRRGLLWVLDEEMVTPASCENRAVERVCQYYSNMVRQCEQLLQCEVKHLMGSDPVRYDLAGWFSLIQNNPSALNTICLLQNSTVGVVKAMFTPRISLPPLCRALGGLEGGSQRSLQRNGTIRKTFSGGMAAIRRHSQCIAVKLQADALINLIRRARPVFLQCVSAKTDNGSFDIPALRVQLHSTQILSALQLYRIGYSEHMTLGDFRCHFQALAPSVMKRYASVFVSHDERKAVEELLVELDVDKKSILVGASRVFMKRGVLCYLEQQREKQVTGWLVHLQAACLGHLARQKYRKLKITTTWTARRLLNINLNRSFTTQAVTHDFKVLAGNTSSRLQLKVKQTFKTLTSQLYSLTKTAALLSGTLENISVITTEWKHSSTVWTALGFRHNAEMKVEELSTVRQALQADLETSIRRIVDLQAALEEVESSDDSDTESVHTAVESFTQKKDLDSVSSVGSVGGEGIHTWSGVSRGGSRGGSSLHSSQGGRQSVADTISTYSLHSCVNPDDEGSEAGGVASRSLGRAPSSTALSELLEGLRKRRAGGDAGDETGSTVSLAIYQTTGASTLRRRASALSLSPEDVQEPRPGPSILKPSSPLLPRSTKTLSAAGGKVSRFNSGDSLSSLPSLPHLSSLAARHHAPSVSIPEEEKSLHSVTTPIQRSPLAPRQCMVGSLIPEDVGEGSLGSEPMVFQNRRLPLDRDDAASDILPAIRRAQSTSSLASSVRGGRRALSVHFGELPPSSHSRKSSESESSSSGGSGRSSQGGGPRRRFERPQGERLEAEGSEGGDVASLMKKYLKKETD